MADGSPFFAAPGLADARPETRLFHDGDFHDPSRLPGRALRMLAVTTQLRLPAGSPPRLGIDPVQRPG